MDRAVFGVRWQSEAATPLCRRARDIGINQQSSRSESTVALRFGALQGCRAQWRDQSSELWRKLA